MKKLLEVAKPFTMKMTKKSHYRPVLSTALVTENHVIATDTYRLIRIKHNEQVSSPYLHHFQKEYSAGQEVDHYPNIERLFPDTRNAEISFSFSVEELRSIHDQALIVAKEHQKQKITLKNDQFIVEPNSESDTFNHIGFTHTLPVDTKIEKLAYNCKYMVDVLKALKKLKQQDAALYYYSSTRPILIVAEDVEILLMPIR